MPLAPLPYLSSPAQLPITPNPTLPSTPVALIPLQDLPGMQLRHRLVMVLILINNIGDERNCFKKVRTAWELLRRAGIFFNCEELPTKHLQKPKKNPQKGQWWKKKDHADDRNRRLEPHRHRILTLHWPLLWRPALGHPHGWFAKNQVPTLIHLLLFSARTELAPFDQFHQRNLF